MGRSSLLGVDSATREPAGRDKATLGPSDSSDSGSDVTGLEADDDDADPGLPVDVALRDDQGAPLPLGESLPASEGEAGVRDGADIGVDRVFTPGEGDDVDALLDAVDEAPVSDDEDEEDEDEDEDEDASAASTPVPAQRRRGAKASAAGDADEEELPGNADAESSHRPGRS